MHYYQFHIADFALHTTHLSLEEEAVYRRLLDYYYDTEKPIPKETNAVIRRLRLVNYAEIVESIIDEFFVLQSDGWHNLRADFEINSYHLKAETAKANGKKGGRPKKNNPTETGLVIIANPAETGLKANHKPITNNHKPITSKQTTTSRASALDYSRWPSIPSDQVLKDWLDMRKRLKANVSQTVINNFTTELNLSDQAGYSVDQCLSECVTRNWRGFKFEWIKEKQNATHQRAGRETLSERANRAADEAFGTGSQSGVLEGCFDILNENGSDQLTGSRGLPDLG